MAQRSISAFFTKKPGAPAAAAAKKAIAPVVIKPKVATPPDKQTEAAALKKQHQEEEEDVPAEHDEENEAPRRTLKRLRRNTDAPTADAELERDDGDESTRKLKFSPDQQEPATQQAPASRKRQLKKKQVVSSEGSEFDEKEPEASASSESSDESDASVDSPVKKKARAAPKAKATPKVAAPKAAVKSFTPAAPSNPKDKAAANQAATGSQHRADPEWLKPENIKDKEGRRPDHPEYDPTTLKVPWATHGKKFTPGMKQWWEFKENHFDKVLLFKMGKFYELFENDADIAHQELGLMFMGSTDKKHVGFPEISLAPYTAKLTARGFRCAVIEQTQTPDELKLVNAERKKNKQVALKVVRRELCQIVSKGTRFDPGTINEACASYLVAITESEAGSKLAFAIVDTATGRFMIGGCEEKELCKPGLATMLE